MTCLWCGAPFEPRASGGKPQRFCRPEHRRLFDTAVSEYGRYAVEAGLVTVGELKECFSRNARVAIASQSVVAATGQA